MEHTLFKMNYSRHLYDDYPQQVSPRANFVGPLPFSRAVFLHNSTCPCSWLSLPGGFQMELVWNDLKDYSVPVVV